MKTLAALSLASAALLAASTAIACQMGFHDLNGQAWPNYVPQPDGTYRRELGSMTSGEHGLFETVRSEIDMSIASSPLSFVGTVLGYRTYGGVVIDDDIHACRSDTCGAIADVMSVVIRVDSAIEGIGDGQLHEVLYSTGDGDCEPDFRPGRRYLYGAGVYGAVELPAPPTPEQLAHWRDLARLPAWPRRRIPVALDYSRPATTEEITDLLAIYRPEQAFIGRVLQYRLDDTTLTDAWPCTDQLAPECTAFKRRIVSIVVEPQTVISGDLPTDTYEVGFGRWPFAGPYLPEPGMP